MAEAFGVEGLAGSERFQTPCICAACKASFFAKLHEPASGTFW